MKDPIAESLNVSLFISKSSSLTSANRTGSWSFARPRRAERSAPCSAACPCAEDVPRIEMLASRGLSTEALSLILEENPLPGVCGRVCLHPCEEACNRGALDEAVSVNALERALADEASDGAAAAAPGRADRPASARRRIAIIGSGPAGLSAAYFLRRLGHDCEILEAAEFPGGLLRLGIPEYRLPTSTLEREIARVEALGVRIRLGCRVDENALAELRRDFDAVAIAAGKGRASTLGVPGEDLAFEALGFLAAARRGEAPRFARGAARVAVVGGGNTAVDAARTLARLGAEPVIVYRRRREDMPAIAAEVEAALAEGVRLEELAEPAAIEGPAGRLRLMLRRMRAGESGPDGRASVAPSPGGGFELEVAAVCAAVGSSAAEPWMIPPEDSRLRLARCAIDFGDPRGGPLAYLGDLAGGRESVSDAVASGKEAAIALDAFFARGASGVAGELERSLAAEGGSASMEVYLGGPRRARSRSVVRPEDLNADYVEASRRPSTRALDPARAVLCFEEAEGGLGPSAALAEAARCLNCGTCDDCDNCRTFCPEAAVDVGPPAEGDPPWRPSRAPNLDYCKGCGICAIECPRGALVMEEASS
jgi:NADPH-dependent glutamate synthase beta subunit-like oxidoreductase